MEWKEKKYKNIYKIKEEKEKKKKKRWLHVKVANHFPETVQAQTTTHLFPTKMYSRWIHTSPLSIKPTQPLL